jgi:hypothetical protein
MRPIGRTAGPGMVPPIGPDAFVVDDVLRWVEEEEVNGGVPYRVLVALSPNSGQGSALDHSAHFGGHVRSLPRGGKTLRLDSSHWTY